MTTIYIGVGDHPGICNGDDIIVLPGECVPLGTGARIHPVSSLADCLEVIRGRFPTHEAIATMGSTKIVYNFPSSYGIRDEWTRAINELLEQILDYMGNCALDSWIGARNAIKNGPYLETCPNLESLHNALEGSPAVCVGAGPTAQRQLRDIDPCRQFVFACDAMAAGMCSISQFVCMVERVEACVDLVKDIAGEGSRLIAPPVIDPRVATAFKGKCLWWLGSDPISTWLAPGASTATSGRSSGVLTIAAALLAGCNPIYLVGHDLAYDNGVSHAAAAHALCPLDHNGTPATDSHILHTKRYQTPANGGGTVETCGIFQLFRHDIEVLLASYPGRTVINCGGLSKIRGTVMGELPKSYKPVVDPCFLINPIKNWQPEIPRLIANMNRIQRDCEKIMIRLDIDPDTAAIAESLAVSKMVDADVSPLFNYIFRALSNNLNLRLHFRISHGYDQNKAHRSVLRSLASTMHAMCDRMITELA